MRTKERIVGKDTYVSKHSGELIVMDIVESVEYEKDTNFHKLFLNNFTESLSGIINKKTALCFWILSHMTRENKFFYTYRQISKKTGYSYKTVADTIQALLEQDFLFQSSYGHYMVNPNIIFKGSYQRRCIAMEEYNNMKSRSHKDSEELRLLAITKNIRRLEKQKEKLEQKLAVEESS